jgi:hypothetical protein
VTNRPSALSVGSHRDRPETNFFFFRTRRLRFSSGICRYLPQIDRRGGSGNRYGMLSKTVSVFPPDRIRLQFILLIVQNLAQTGCMQSCWSENDPRPHPRKMVKKRPRTKRGQVARAGLGGRFARAICLTLSTRSRHILRNIGLSQQCRCQRRQIIHPADVRRVP